MSKIVPIDAAEMLVAAARALAKVDLYGSPRGVTMINTQEIEAMVLLLAALGLRPLPPSDPAPANPVQLFTPH